MTAISNIYLAHGASGNAASMEPWTGALIRRGYPATPVQLPRGSAERAVPTYRAAVPELAGAAIGGHSFGGRVASLLAAEERPAAVILLSFPLHPPGGADRWEQRTAHFADIACPVLLLSGDRDPFARVELLRRAAARLPDGELVVYAGQRHGLALVREAALDAIEAFLHRVAEGATGPG